MIEHSKSLTKMRLYEEGRGPRLTKVVDTEIAPARAPRALVMALIAVALLTVALYPVQADTQEPFFEGSEDGWFWYEDPEPVLEEEEPKQPIVTPAAATPAGPLPLSAEWLRTNLPKLLDSAIDAPTDENVAAYFYAQRMMMDKAQVFSDVAQQVVQTDPLLDENLRVPFASAAKASLMYNAKQTTGEILRDLSEKMGLWVFHDPLCPYCNDQVNAINQLVKRHGLKITYISKTDEPVPGLHPEIQVKPADGRFEKLGITHTPAVMMLEPPGGFYLISQGFAGLSTLESRIINVAYRQGMVSENNYFDAVPTARGVVTSGLNDGETKEIDWEKPSEWVPYVQRVIQGTYGVGVEDDDQTQQ